MQVLTSCILQEFIKVAAQYFIIEPNPDKHSEQKFVLRVGDHETGEISPPLVWFVTKYNEVLSLEPDRVALWFKIKSLEGNILWGETVQEGLTNTSFHVGGLTMGRTADGQRLTIDIPTSCAVDEPDGNSARAGSTAKCHKITPPKEELL